MKKIVSLFTISLCLVACSHVPYQRETFSRVSSHELDPSESFVSGKTLYLHYQLEDSPLWLAGSLEKTKKVAEEQISQLSVQAQAPQKEQNDTVALTDYSFEQVLHRALRPLVPAVPGEGVMVMVYNLGTLLYRKADGQPALAFLKDAPADVHSQYLL